VMSENKKTEISKARTLEEIGKFWDTHSLDDYWDETREAEFKVRAERRRRITVEPQIYKQIEAEARAALFPKHWSIYGWLKNCRF
ncbi:MAG: hypothetical protein ACR2GD_08165, partial [Pyrinomonadaceae bacterium]